MRKLFLSFLIVTMVNCSFLANNDTLTVENNQITSATDIITSEHTTLSENISEIDNLTKEQQKNIELQKAAEKIPIVFGQWWFWMGLGVILLFLKFVIFKK